MFSNQIDRQRHIHARANDAVFSSLPPFQASQSFSFLLIHLHRIVCPRHLVVVFVFFQRRQEELDKGGAGLGELHKVLWVVDSHVRDV